MRIIHYNKKTNRITSNKFAWLPHKLTWVKHIQILNYLSQLLRKISVKVENSENLQSQECRPFLNSLLQENKQSYLRWVCLAHSQIY